MWTLVPQIIVLSRYFQIFENDNLVTVQRTHTIRSQVTFGLQL